MGLLGRVLCGLIVTAAVYLGSCHGRTFSVGWVLDPSEGFNHWAERNRFLVDDILHFRYRKGDDSVLQVNRDDYYSCNIQSPIVRLDSGDDDFRLDRSGPFYFVSGVKSHCQKGEKLVVVVLSDRHRFPPPPATYRPVPPSPTPAATTPTPHPSPASVSVPSSPSQSPTPHPSPVVEPPQPAAPASYTPTASPSVPATSPATSATAATSPEASTPVPGSAPTTSPQPSPSTPAEVPSASRSAGGRFSVSGSMMVVMPVTVALVGILIGI